MLMCRNDATQRHLMYFKIAMLCFGTIKSIICPTKELRYGNHDTCMPIFGHQITWEKRKYIISQKFVN